MADQKRWFKLWCSVLTDDDLQSLSPADRWAWAALGCHTKQAGTRGRVVISLSNAALAGALGVPLEELKATILRLPHLTFEEVKNSHGELSVTWQNWVKYQEDSTQAERQQASRSKRRGEKEENKNKKTTSSPSPPPSVVDPFGEPEPEPAWGTPEALVELYNRLVPPGHPRVTRLTPARRQKAQVYLKQFPERPFWTGVFTAIRFSGFLRGERSDNGHRGYRADFDWLLTKGKDGTENAVKVEEGRYADARD